MKYVLSILLLLFTVMCLWIDCSVGDPQSNNNPPGSGTETVGGILVDSTGTPVSEAAVHVRPVDPSSTILYHGFTDDTGAYEIDSVKQGVYNLFGFTSDTSLLVKRDSIVKQDQISLNLGVDTMVAPGGLFGRVLLDSVSKAGVKIYVHGYSYVAHTNDSGYYKMENVYPGIYTLGYSYIGYREERDTGVVVLPATIDTLPTKHLVLDTINAPPAPKNLRLTYDTLSGVATLVWDPVPVADLNHYKVYHDSAGTPVLLGTAKQNLFVDSIFSNLLDTSSYERVYQVVAVDNGNNASLYSNPLDLVALSPTLLRTYFTFAKVHDTLVNGQEVTLALSYTNKTRLNTRILWYCGNPLDTVRIDTISDKSGTDTLVYAWQDSGYHTVRVEALDNGGQVWCDSLRVRILDSSQIYIPDTWRDVKAMTHKRRFNEAICVNDALYVLGGGEDFYNGIDIIPRALTVAEKFTFADSTWVAIDSMPTPRFTAAVAAVQKKIYVIGGRNLETTHNTIDVYNTETGNWEAPITMPSIRYGHVARVRQDTIFLFGGYKKDNNGLVITADIDAFVPATNTWELKRKMQTPRAYHQVVQMENQFYILGGIENLEGLRSVEIYDPTTNHISRGDPLRQARMHFGAVVLNNEIYVVGGMVSLLSSEMLSSMDAFDKEKGWHERKPLSKARHSFGICGYKGILYVTGGADKEFPYLGQLNTILKYYP